MADMVGGAFLYLRAWNSTFETHYYPGIADHLQRFGKTTRLIPRNPETQLQGNVLEVEVKGAHNRSTRVTLDLMEPMPDPGPGSYARYSLTFDHSDSTNNDFAALEIGFRTTIYDIWKRSDRTWKGNPNPVETDFQEGMADVRESFARFFHLPTNGLLATVDATTATRNDDADNWTDATTYTAGSTTARILLQPASIARIGIGQIIEIRDTVANGYGLIVDNVKVTYVHPYDNTIDVRLHGVTGSATLTPSQDAGGNTVTNFDNVAVSNTIFLHGNYNVVPKGTLNDFFDSATYYDQNRRTFPNQILQPIIINLGSNVVLAEDHFVRAGEVAGWQQGDSNAVAPRTLVMARDQYRAARNLAKDGGLTIVPGTSQEAGSLRRVIGEDGFVVYDPNLGHMALIVEDFAEYGQIDFLDMATWELVTPFAGGFRMLPGDIEGIWNRESEDDGTGRPSKTFSAQGIWSFAFINRGAHRNTRIRGLSTAA